MYSTLMPENLTDLSIFECEQCFRRLQVPIMRTGISTNICGSCIQKMPNSPDVVGNVQLERMMAKLHFPCNYNEEGCTFHGSFYKTCEHEKRCRFKKRSCPFVNLKKCEIDANYSLDDMITHIQEQHADKILKVENEIVSIENPSEESRDMLFLIDFDGNYFILRSIWMEAEDVVIYAFARLTDNIIAKAVKFASDAFIANKTNKDLDMSKFDWIQYDQEDMFTAKLSVLQKLGFEDEINVFFYIENLPQQINPVRSLKSTLTWWKCEQCHALVDNANFCTKCFMFISCKSCKTDCADCNASKYLVLIELHESDLDSNFLCNSPGCPEFIRGDKYDIHCVYQCLFKKHSCPCCEEQHYNRDMAKHLNKSHRNSWNRKELCVMKLDWEKTRIFDNDGDIFVEKYRLSEDQEFHVQTIKITEPHWDTSYAWKVDIKKGSVASKLSIFGDCTMDGSCTDVKVSEYLKNDYLEFYPYVISHI